MKFVCFISWPGRVKGFHLGIGLWQARPSERVGAAIIVKQPWKTTERRNEMSFAPRAGGRRITGLFCAILHDSALYFHEWDVLRRYMILLAPHGRCGQIEMAKVV